MENKNEKALEPVSNDNDNIKERLLSIAEKSNLTVDELLDTFEERETVIGQNDSAKNRSTGSQSSENSFDFDPTGNEFLRGIWGR